MADDSIPQHTVKRKQAVAQGLTKYFTGKPCPQGHVAYRWVSSKGCCECADAYRATLPKEVGARYARKWRETNPEKAAEVLARFRTKHKARILREARIRYFLDIERQRNRVADWRARNPDAVRAHAMARWARKKGSFGSYDHRDIADLKRLQNNKCAWCRKSLRHGFHVDHILPLSKGGHNTRKNLQLLCPFDNMSKHNKNPIDWAQQNGRLL